MNDFAEFVQILGQLRADDRAHVIAELYRLSAIAQARVAMSFHPEINIETSEEVPLSLTTPLPLLEYKLG